MSNEESADILTRAVFIESQALSKNGGVPRYALESVVGVDCADIRAAANHDDYDLALKEWAVEQAREQIAKESNNLACTKQEG